MFERFTYPARAAVIRAKAEADELRHRSIGTEHVLLALLADADGDVARLLAADGLDAGLVRAEILRRIGRGEATVDERAAADADALRAIGIDLDAVRAKIEEAFGPGALALPPAQPPPRRLLRRSKHSSRFSDRSKKCLELSLREAIRLKQTFIAPEHILLGVLRDGNGLGAQIMADAGVDFDDLRSRLERSLQRPAA